MTTQQIALIKQAIGALNQNATFPADVALALRSLNEALEIEQDDPCAELEAKLVTLRARIEDAPEVELVEVVEPEGFRTFAFVPRTDHLAFADGASVRILFARYKS